MTSVSIWHWVILLFPLAIIVSMIWMIARVVRKAGYSGWWAAATVVPLLNLVMLWVFAFADWPALSGTPRRPTTRP